MRFPGRSPFFAMDSGKSRPQNIKQYHADQSGKQMGKKRKTEQERKGDRHPDRKDTSANAAKRQLAEMLQGRKQTQDKKYSDDLPHKKPEDTEHRATSFL